MFKVLKIVDGKVTLANLESKTIKFVELSDCYKGISVDDTVEIFEDESVTVVTKLDEVDQKVVNVDKSNLQQKKVLKKHLSISIKNIIISAALGIGLAIISLQFIKLPSNYENLSILNSAIETLKNNIGTENIIYDYKDINFYTSPEKLMQNGFYIKSFITGKVTISYDADDGRSAFGDKKINFICAIYEDENISCDY